MNGWRSQGTHGVFNESNSLNGYHMSGINFTETVGGVFDESNSLNGTQSPTKPSEAIGAPDPNYDFYNRYARGLNPIVAVGQSCVGIGSDNGLYNISARSNMRAFKLNSDVPPQYAGTHRHCLVETTNGLRHYLIPNSVVKSAYWSNTIAGKPPTLGGLSGDETGHGTTTLAVVGAAALAAGLGIGYLLHRK